MRLNAEVLRYMTKEEFRVLTAVEMGQKNHEFVPVPLIQSIASLKRHSVQDIITSLLKNKLLYRNSQKYEGLKLTYLGYDYLALHAFVKRGLLSGVGVRIGVGKESDIHICQTTDGKVVVLKLHRLGRISFRSIKRNRDYLQRRQHASWMYLARLAALKEFFYLKALHEHEFPVPKPIDVNRHAVLMEYVDAIPFREVKELANPMRVLEKLMHLIVRLGRAGVIHGDFNEFNLMINGNEQITLIDLPQMVSTQHPNAQMYFERDVECIRNLFARKFKVEVTQAPRFREVCREFSSTAIDSTHKQLDNCGSKSHRKSFCVEEVLQPDELRAVDEALLESRRQRIEATHSDGDKSSYESPSEPNFDAGDGSDNVFGDRSSTIRETNGRRRDTESDAAEGHSSAEGTDSSHGSDASDENLDETHVSSVRCYHPKSRKHDPAVVRKRVQQSERKKINHMGNSGRNKNPERIRARREMARY